MPFSISVLSLLWFIPIRILLLNSSRLIIRSGGGSWARPPASGNPLWRERVVKNAQKRTLLHGRRIGLARVHQGFRFFSAGWHCCVVVPIILPAGSYRTIFLFICHGATEEKRGVEIVRGPSKRTWLPIGMEGQRRMCMEWIRFH